MEEKTIVKWHDYDPKDPKTYPTSKRGGSKLFTSEFLVAARAKGILSSSGRKFFVTTGFWFSQEERWGASDENVAKWAEMPEAPEEEE